MREEYFVIGICVFVVLSMVFVIAGSIVIEVRSWKYNSIMNDISELIKISENEKDFEVIKVMLHRMEKIQKRL
jgi:hypothetical protein